MQVKTEQRKIPAYATRSTSKGWLWSVWLDKQSSVRRFQTQSPSFSGFAQNKAEAIECCSQKLGINLMEAKIYMVSRPKQTGENIPGWQKHKFNDADVVQLWGTCARVLRRREVINNLLEATDETRTN